jgi:hypothetical protein
MTDAATPEPPKPPHEDIVSVLRRLQAIVRSLEVRILAGEQATGGTLTPTPDIADRNAEIRVLRGHVARLELQLQNSERARGALEERVSYQLRLLEERPPSGR